MAWHRCRWQDRPVILREKEGGGRRARLDSVCDCLHQTKVHFSREKSSTFRKLQRVRRCLDIQRRSLVFCQIAEQLLPQGAFTQDVACAALAAGFSILFEWAADDRAKSADFSKVLVGVEWVKCSAETQRILFSLTERRSSNRSMKTLEGIHNKYELCWHNTDLQQVTWLLKLVCMITWN